jgi:hypothetical protein
MDWPLFWSALAGVGAIGGAVATFLTYRVVKRYTDETQKLREAANHQLAIMKEQAELATKLASAQSVLTFSFGKGIGNVEMPNIGKCIAYPLIVEGKGFQNLTAEVVASNDKQRFVLLDFNNHRGMFGTFAAWDARVSHILLWVPEQVTLSRSSSTCFRLTYVDALRNSRWDEFTFEVKDSNDWKPVWVRSGYSVTASLTFSYNIEGKDKA